MSSTHSRLEIAAKLIASECLVVAVRSCTGHCRLLFVEARGSNRGCLLAVGQGMSTARRFDLATCCEKRVKHQDLLKL